VILLNIPGGRLTKGIVEGNKAIRGEKKGGLRKLSLVANMRVPKTNFREPETRDRRNSAGKDLLIKSLLRGREVCAKAEHCQRYEKRGKDWFPPGRSDEETRTTWENEKDGEQLKRNRSSGDGSTSPRQAAPSPKTSGNGKWRNNLHHWGQKDR